MVDFCEELRKLIAKTPNEAARHKLQQVLEAHCGGGVHTNDDPDPSGGGGGKDPPPEPDPHF